MSAQLRGFGFTFDAETGRTRNWYLDDAGVQRWIDNNDPLPGQLLTGNADLVPAQHQTLGEAA